MSLGKKYFGIFTCKQGPESPDTRHNLLCIRYSRSGRLLNALCTFHLYLVYSGDDGDQFSLEFNFLWFIFIKTRRHYPSFVFFVKIWINLYFNIFYDWYLLPYIQHILRETFASVFYGGRYVWFLKTKNAQKYIFT